LRIPGLVVQAAIQGAGAVMSRAINVRQTVRLLVLVGAVLASLPQPAAAQHMSRTVIETSAGWVGFADDGVVSEGLVGTAVRWYLTPRVSVGPEVVWIAGRNHSHLVSTGNVTFDLLSPKDGHPRRVTPFIVAGGGVFRTTESFVDGDFTSAEGAFTAGGGLRASPTGRVTCGVEARVGWELHIRINGFIGMRF
jgi:hypothetical protein